MMLSAIAALTAIAHQPAPPSVSMPDGEALVATIASHDASLFWAAFEGCDPDMLATYIAPDYRMVHDLVGLALPTGEAMIENSRKQCATRAPGGENEGYANRRLLVPGSRRVQALGEWGALEEGHHGFYERRRDGSWELTGGGRYIHVWQWMGDRFLLTESISVDHGPAPDYPPESADD